jgi:methionyl-tRNA formyltransferase
MALIVEAPKSILRFSAAMEKNLRIAFFGTPLFAVPALRRLHQEGWPISLVVTAPDKPVGRRMLLTPSPVKSTALELGLPVRTPMTLKDDGFFQEFENIRPDLCIVVAYGKLIPQQYLDIPRLGWINIHPSKLPQYRGASPIQSAILDGLQETAISLMLLDREMDHGPILAQESWTIPSGFDYPAAESELAQKGADLLAQILPEYAEGHITPQPQNHEQATFTKKFERADGRINWTGPAQAIAHRIRALAANPGTWTTWSGKTLNIIHAHPLDESFQASPGAIVLQGKSVIVVCGQGGLALETVQLEGSPAMGIRDFVNGRPAFIGSVLA